MSSDAFKIFYLAATQSGKTAKAILPNDPVPTRVVSKPYLK